MLGLSDQTKQTLIQSLDTAAWCMGEGMLEHDTDEWLAVHRAIVEVNEKLALEPRDWPTQAVVNSRRILSEADDD